MSVVDPFAGRLLAGERVLWSGRPAGGLLLTPRDFFLVPFSFLWCGFVIYWAIGAGTSGGAPFTLFGVVFLGVGLFLSIGRFGFDAWLRGNTHYQLTDRRVLIARSGRFADFTAVGTDALVQAQLTEKADGKGTIRFGQPAGAFGGGSGFSIWIPSLDPTPQFLAIADVRRVFDLAQQCSAQSG